MDQISTRTLLLILVGVFTAYLVMEHPAVGAALGTAVAVVTLIRELLRR
ncbi:hypothetical protein CFP59_04837 [Streptomyces malaysiensis subsp. malaysiensis]|nr:hypothetical protein CFP59_04837 [Streptomyces sp. M56]